MNNTTITILFTIFAIILLAGCTSQSQNNVVTTETNKSTTQTTTAVSNVSNGSVTTTGSNVSNASTTCSDKQCFTAAADGCGNETIQITEDYGVVKYTTTNCVLTKTVISLDQNESADMKHLLEDKNMTCRYEKGKFDQNWINSLLLGVEKCEGGLKDAIADLLVFS
jgi:hypothetical protein